MGALLNMAVQPHSLLDLLIPSKVELRDSGGKVVYAQDVRLNALVLPDNLNLAPGQYTLYVNSEYKDTLQVTGSSQEPQSAAQDEQKPSGVQVKQVNGVQSITWDEKPSRAFSFTDSPTMKKLTEQMVIWAKQQRVFWAEVNTALFGGAVLLALGVVVFHATALAAAIISPGEGWVHFLQNGWRAFPYTAVSALVWLIGLGGLAIPFIGIPKLLDFPYHQNIEAGIISFVTAAILCRVSSVVTGSLKREAALLCTVVPAIITALCASYPPVYIVFMALLIWLIPAIAGVMGSSGAQTTIGETETESKEAWRETLL